LEIEADVHPQENGAHIEGTLLLRGRPHPLRSELALGADRPWQASFELTPSRCGIAPYKALGGAIRLQARVRVVVSLKLDNQAPTNIFASPDPVLVTPIAATESPR